jgi:hypothetical protein
MFPILPLIIPQVQCTRRTAATAQAGLDTADSPTLPLRRLREKAFIIVPPLRCLTPRVSPSALAYSDIEISPDTSFGVINSVDRWGVVSSGKVR